MRTAFQNLIPLLILLCSSFAGAQHSLNLNQGAYGHGLGGVKTVLPRAESCFTNPANLPMTTSHSISAFLDNRYFTNSLYQSGIGGIFSRDKDAFSMSVLNYGLDSYNEFYAGLGYGRKLAPKLSLGVKLNWYQFNLQDYGKGNFIGFDIGVHHQLTEKLSAAFLVSNPLKTEISDDIELNSSSNLGLSYVLSDKLCLVIELQKERNYDLRGVFGLDYEFIKNFGLLLGYNTDKNQMSFGLRGQIKKVEAIIASGFHPDLGVSGTLGINVSLGR